MLAVGLILYQIQKETYKTVFKIVQIAPGYMTTTQIKFIMVLYDDARNHDQKAVDDSIKRLFAEIHRLYVGHTLNPFSTVNAPISSTRFDSEVQTCVTAYNQSRI